MTSYPARLAPLQMFPIGIISDFYEMAQDPATLWAFLITVGDQLNVTESSASFSQAQGYILRRLPAVVHAARADSSQCV